MLGSSNFVGVVSHKTNRNMGVNYFYCFMMFGNQNIFMVFCRGDMLCLYLAERLGSLAEIKP